MKTAKLVSVLAVLVLPLAACGGTPPPSGDAPVATNTLPVVVVVPTDTKPPEPTLTNTLEPTNTPEGQIFHDDFNVGLKLGWTWQDENPDRWRITPEGWLEIAGEDPSLLGDGHQSNLLCRPAPAGDYQITVHVYANTFANFQQATLYVYMDGQNYIALLRGFCGPCFSGGNGLFMEYKMAGSPGAYKIPTDESYVFLRLVVQGTSITGYYAFAPEEWQRFGSIGNFIKDPSICLGVSNVDGQGIDADLVGMFDYIDISLP